MYLNIKKNTKTYYYLGYHIYEWADSYEIPYDVIYKAWVEDMMAETLFLYSGCCNLY